MHTCDRCGRSDFVDIADDGNLTCFNCGKVLDESSNLRVEVDIVNNGGVARACGSVVSLTSNGITASTTVPRNHSVHRRVDTNSVQKQIDIIGNKLNVGEAMLAQMHHLHHTITQNEEKYTRSPDVLAAAIIYIVMRQNSRPFTLLDLSQAIQKNVFLVGRVYDLILRTHRDIKVNEVHPSIFVDKVCSDIKHIDAPTLAKVKFYANQIINTIKPHWVHTGKRLDAVCVAAIYIAAEAAGSFSSFKDLCHTIKAGEGTAKLRMREIKKELMQITAPKLPWMREINIKDMHKHLGKMLSQLETLQRLADNRNASSSSSSSPPSSSSSSSPPLPSTPPCTLSPLTPPPASHSPTPSATAYIDKKEDFDIPKHPLPQCYLTNLAARTRRQEKLENAKRRIKKTLDSDPSLAKVLSPKVKAAIENLPPLSTPPPPPPPPSTYLDIKYPVAPIYKRSTPEDPNTPTTPPPSSSPPLSSSPPPLLSSPPTPPSPSSPPSPTGKAFPQLAQAPPAQHPALTARRRGGRTAAPSTPIPEKEKPLACVLPSLDHEDLIIEKLLLNGVSEAQILDGYYFTEQNSEIKRYDIHSEAVGEDDIPESEMCNFIRTQEEVDILKRFEEGESNLLPEGEEKKKKKRKKASTKRKRTSKQKKKEEKEEEDEDETAEEEKDEKRASEESEVEVEEDEPLQLHRKKSRATAV